MCLGTQCQGEGTLPGQPGMWKLRHGTQSGVHQPDQVQSLPVPASAYGHGSTPCTLLRTALTSYSLRKPTLDLAAFWA